MAKDKHTGAEKSIKFISLTFISQIFCFFSHFRRQTGENSLHIKALLALFSVIAFGTFPYPLRPAIYRNVLSLQCLCLRIIISISNSFSVLLYVCLYFKLLVFHLHSRIIELTLLMVSFNFYSPFPNFLDDNLNSLNGSHHCHFSNELSFHPEYTPADY